MKTPSLLDYLHYVAKRTFKGHALYLELSQAPSFPHAADLDTTLKEYEQTGSCLLWTLPNGDKVAFFNNNKVHHLMLLALKIKGFIGQNTYAKIVTSYDLKTQYSLLYNRVYSQLLVPETEELHSLSIMQKVPHKPFSYEDLQKALTHLEATSLTHLIRKQPVYTMTPTGQQVLLTSWFVRLSDIRRALIPATDMTTNPFLSAALREAAEQKVFQKILSTPNWTGGLNLSVSFLKSTTFQDWCATHTPFQKKQIFFDISFQDVLENWHSFISLKEHLSAQGYRFILRLKEVPTFLGLIGVPADFIKLPQTALSDVKIPDNILQDVIVTHVSSSEKALPFIQEGFTHLQGFLTPATNA